MQLLIIAIISDFGWHSRSFQLLSNSSISEPGCVYQSYVVHAQCTRVHVRVRL